MFPILNLPPSSLPIPSLWAVPVHQPQASSIVHRTWTGNSFHTWYYTCFNAILPNNKVLNILFLVAQKLRIHMPMQEMQVRSLGQEDPFEKAMTTYSSILVWEIPWTQRPGGLQSIGLQSQTWLSDKQQHWISHVLSWILQKRKTGWLCGYRMVVSIWAVYPGDRLAGWIGTVAHCPASQENTILLITSSGKYKSSK